MRIPVVNITHDVNGFERLAAVEHEASSCLERRQAAQIDLSGVTWLAAPMCATLGALVDRLRERGAVTVSLPKDRAARTILERNGFAAAFGGRRLPDFYGSTIDYEVQPIGDEGVTRRYLRERLLDRSEMVRYGASVRRRIEHAFGEIRENAREHGRTRLLHVCGQLFPNRHELTVQIVDRGIGFEACVNSALGTGWSARRCLEWAMEAGSTTRKGDRPGGLGLKELRSFLTRTGGSLHIVSGGAVWSLHGGDVIVRDLRHPLGVTVVSITFATSADDPDEVPGLPGEEDFF